MAWPSLAALRFYSSLTLVVTLEKCPGDISVSIFLNFLLVQSRCEEAKHAELENVALRADILPRITHI